MAKPYKKSYRNKRRNRYKKKSKRGTVNYKKLMDKKINTSIERRMVEISNMNQVTLINRVWLAGGDPNNVHATPVFGPQSENKSYHNYERITSKPYVSAYIDAIQAADINQPLNIVDPIAPNVAGVNRGMVNVSAHGKRSSNIIKIKAISLDIRIKSDYGMDELHNTNANLALEIIRESFKRTQGNIELFYRVVQVTADPAGTLPPPEEVATLALRYSDWGYSPKLDVQTEKERRVYKYKTLISGRVNCSPRISFSKHGRDVAPVPIANEDPTANIIPYFREIKQYRKFMPPIEIEYEPADQNGLAKTNNAIYFICRSNVDVNGLVAPADQSACPRIAVICKTYYIDI